MANTSAEKADNLKLECHEAPQEELQVVVQIWQPAKTFGGGKKGAEGHQLGHARGRHPRCHDATEHASQGVGMIYDSVA